MTDASARPSSAGDVERISPDSGDRRGSVNDSLGGYFARPLAPASMLVLIGVVVPVAALLFAVATQVDNDYLASGGCFVVLLSGAAVLDCAGRRRARLSPNSLYRSDGLPTERTALKPVLLVATLLALIAYAMVTAKPGEWGSPLPYFLAAEFLFLVLPQLVAWRVVRRAASSAGDGQ